MNLMIFNVVLLRVFECLIIKDVISEANKKLMIEKDFECSIINPFFGHLFSIKMLPNLRNYYYNIIPAYKDGGIRDYINDKDSDCLSYVLINLFPTLEEDISMTKEGSLKSMVNYFLDTRIRNTSIKSFGMLFAKIANCDELLIDIKPMDESFNNKLKELFNKVKEIYNDREQVSLVLLTIHSFMLTVLNSKEEYHLYINTILENIKSEILQSNNEFLFKNLLSYKETEKIEENFLNELYSYDLSKMSCKKEKTSLFNISNIMDNVVDNNDGIKSKIFTNVDSSILHLCNSLFFDEESNSFKLDHLLLNENSLLKQFYKKYSQRFEFKEDVLLDWSKVVDGLKNINLVSKTNNLFGKIRYVTKKDKKELDVGILNIISVLTKLCMSSSNKVMEKYIEYFDQDINGYEILKKYEDFLNVLVSDNVKVICKGDTIRKSKDDFYGVFYTMINCDLEDKFNQTTLKFFIRLSNIFCYSITTLKNDLNIFIPNISNNENVNSSPIEYIVLKLFTDITGINIQYKESQLDSLYNTYYLNTIDQKEEYLYNLYEGIYEDKIADNIVKVTEMIVKSISSTDEKIKTKFSPFYQIISDLIPYRLSEYEKIIAWQQVLKKYEHLNEENYIVKLWNEEIKKLNLFNTFVDFDNLSSKSLITACDIISNTKLSMLDIKDEFAQQYDWERVFESLNKLKSLKSIHLSSMKINFEDRCRLCKSKSKKIEQITSVRLNNSQANNENDKIISQLLKTKDNKINILDLSNNNLESDSINILCEALKHKNNEVTHLLLDHNNLGLEGIKYVSNVLANDNNKLKELYLANNSISDEKAKFVFKALKDKNNKLKVLDMSNSNLKNSSYIVEAITNENCQLERLYLDSCGLEEKEIGNILEARKKLNIFIKISN